MAVRRETYVRFDPDKLVHRISASGHSGATFAKAAGISPGTLSGILHGSACSAATARQIVKTLKEHPVIEGLQELLDEDVA